MGDSPPFERKSVVRRAAALDFLTNISLGYEKEKPALSDPIPIRDDIAGLKNHEEDNVNVNSKEFPPVRFIERAYGEKEKAAIDFLTNISLDLSVQRADGDTSQEVHTFIPNVVAAGNSYSSTQFPDLGTSFGRTSDMSKTFFPPAYQIYSGEVISKQRTSTSRRSSVDVTGSARFSNTMLDHRIMLTTASGVPLSVFSVISYRDEKLRPKRRRTRSSKYFGRDYFEKIKLNIDIEAVKRRKFAQSFGSLLEPALTLEPKSLENSLYHPFFLDDPELKTGKHRTVITLPCFVSSIIQYSKPSDIKKELNERFRDTHPTVDPTLTLTQIRRLKDRLLRIGEMQDLELSSVACAYVYFEKLVLKNMVNKESRRLVAAACLLLAAKVNDPKEVDYTKLLEAMEKVLDVSKKEVLANEFLIYTALEFTLYIPLWEVMPHLERVVEASATHKTIDEYVGENNFFVHLFRDRGHDF